MKRLVGITLAAALVVFTGTQLVTRATFNSNLTVVQAASADAFVDSLGVDLSAAGNMSYSATSYDYLNTAKPALQNLGVRYIRYVMPSVPNHPNVGMLTDLYTSLGIKSVLTTKLQHVDTNGVVVDSGGDSYTLAPSTVPSIVKAIGPSSVYGVEGPNEYSNRNTYPTWPQPLYTYYSQVRGALKADPATATVRLVSPTLASNLDSCYFTYTSNPCFNPELVFSNIADIGNVHTYVRPFNSPKNYLPIHDWDYQTARWGSTNVITTEVGANTSAKNVGSWSDGVPPTQQAQNVLRDMLELYQKGSKLSMVYQLGDNSTLPSTEPECCYGLMTDTIDAGNIHHWSPKPSYTGLQNMISILQERGASFTPGTLAYGSTNAPSTANSLLLQKSTGDYYLVMWNDVDGQTTGPTPITVQLQAGMQSAEQFSPIDSAAPTNVPITANSVSVSISASPIILHLVPSVAATPTPSPTASPSSSPVVSPSPTVVPTPTPSPTPSPSATPVVGLPPGTYTTFCTKGS